MNFISIVVFVLIFSFLVIVHELGHFWAARWAGVKVEEFGLGLPPRLWGKKRGQTLFSLNAIPFGGFVRLKGEGEHSDEPDSMAHKSYGARALIMFGGVLMNFITAYTVLCVAMWLGLPPLATDPAQLGLSADSIKYDVVVLETQADSPAQKVGLASGDVILAVDDVSVGDISTLQQAVQGKEQIVLKYRHGGKEESRVVQTKTVQGQTVIGVAVDQLASAARYDWWRVPAIAAVDTKNLLARIGEGVWQFVSQIFTKGEIDANVTGPIGIAKVTAQAVELGLLSVLQLIVFLSINLGLINLFPFPALDGGRLAFLLVEIVMRGRKLPIQAEAVIHNLGFLALLVLIAVVTYRDIARLVN